MTLNRLFSKLTKEKFPPSWGYFGRRSKNIYNLPKVILHITPWTLILMLHITQSLCLALANVLSNSFLMFRITFNEVSTTLSIQFYYRAMISSYFGIAFLLFFIKIWNAVYTSYQKSTALFINGFIFDIMNTQNNQSLEFEWKPMLSRIWSVNDQRFSWLCNIFLKLLQDWIGWILSRNAMEILKEMLARECLNHGAANIWGIESFVNHINHCSYPISSLTLD